MVEIGAPNKAINHVTGGILTFSLPHIKIFTAFDKKDEF